MINNLRVQKFLIFLNSRKVFLYHNLDTDLEKGGNLAIDILKVPKREILDHSDFHDFYAIKSLTVSDFGVKIKICLKNI